MLTRREIEGELRGVYPWREDLHRRRQALSSTRRRLRITLIVVVGLGMVVSLSAVTLRPSTPAPGFVRQWAAWGVEHVRSADARVQSLKPVFPLAERRHGSSYAARENARARRARDLGMPRRRAAGDR